jgi:glyoxylase-like metal-dependent hydrolase (beta-lactamase superfamily II)
VRLAERVYLVGSGRLGCALTDDYDCNVYAIDGGDEIALIDAGGGRATAEIVANLRRDGLDPTRVRHLLLTHAHGDHAAGALSVREAFPGLRVAASPETAAWVRDGDERAISLDVARVAGLYPADFAFPPCPVDAVLGDGDEVKVGDLRLRSVETPGHADGHLAFLWEQSLFVGDALFFGGRVSLQKTWDCSVQKTIATVERLAAMKWDAFFPGHLTFSLRDGHRHADVAMRAIRQLGVPAPVTGAG